MGTVEIFQRGNKSRGGETAASARGHGRVLGAHPGDCAQQHWRGSRRGTQLCICQESHQHPTGTHLPERHRCFPASLVRLLCPGFPNCAWAVEPARTAPVWGHEEPPGQDPPEIPRGASPRAGEGAALPLLLQPPSEQRSTWSKQRAVRGTAAAHTWCP